MDWWASMGRGGAWMSTRLQSSVHHVHTLSRVSTVWTPAFVMHALGTNTGMARKYLKVYHILFFADSLDRVKRVPSYELVLGSTMPT